MARRGRGALRPPPSPSSPPPGASLLQPGHCSFDAHLASADAALAKDATSAAQLWLPPSDMVAHNLAAGAAVAVSSTLGLLASRSTFVVHALIWCSMTAAESSQEEISLPQSASCHPKGFVPPCRKQVAVCCGGSGDALIDLTKASASKFGLKPDDSSEELIGTFLVIAAAWPSPKLRKSSVRLSLQLHESLARPELGSLLRVFPLAQGTSTPSSASGMPWLRGAPTKCHKLALRWRAPLQLTSVATPPRTNGSHISFETPRSSSEMTASSVTPAVAASPATPSTVATSSVLSKSSSNGKASTQKKEEQAVLRTPSPESKGFATGISRECRWDALLTLMGQGLEKQRALLELFVLRHLNSRSLILGNQVVVSLCGLDCVFEVVKLHAADCRPGAQASNKELSGQDLSPMKGSSAGKLESEQRVLSYFRVEQSTVLTLQEERAERAAEEDDLVITRDLETETGTDFSNLGAGTSAKPPKLPTASYSTLGGLSAQISALKELVGLPLQQPQLFAKYGLKPPRGVLLYGPPGTGKSSLAHAAACEAGASLFVISGPEVISEFYGESEQALKAVFQAAEHAAPSVVFIDEIDAIAPARGEQTEELMQRMVAALLTIMDGGGPSLERVVVLAATNRRESIDSALRRPGRFDRELEIGVPSPSGRLEILQGILHDQPHKLNKDDIHSLAAITHGFVGADLTALCNEAAMCALRKFAASQVETQDPCCYEASSRVGEPPGEPGRAPDEDSVSPLVAEVATLGLSDSLDVAACASAAEDLKIFSNERVQRQPLEDQLAIDIEDFEHAKTVVRPSALREVMIEIPKVHWSDIGGLEDVKQRLQEAVEWPQKHADAFVRLGAKRPRGVLLYGPPGCSKTLLARAVATEGGLNFLSVKGPELFNKFVGESEKAVKALFALAQKTSPSVIFFDEIDGLAAARGSSGSSEGGISVGDRVLSQLLVEMDGRFDRLLFVGPPDCTARKTIFDIHLRRTPCHEDVQLVELVAETEGYTGADIAAVCREAALAALEETLDATEVHMRHFGAALACVLPSITQLDISQYQSLQRG
eukprot:SM000075S21982  [mRNA]  locus=s75:434791:440447:- [translate_table: standard]